ncbi:zinc ABC transporter substrate-binding protein [uncultured Zoogloea sp.]|uniref:metal ABC transporter substrate-binding protein n=1 Tax=uncultured Zoogloea sp. TaxID=160237 RepID=UPI0026161105|nr:zinc ABC transporter substrate-binding protein [uncultured Zoogloea sp.]
MIDKMILRVVALLCVLLPALPAAASVNVFATVPEWAALAKEIGGDKVNVLAATTALQDPHRIEARPSLIARARSSQLVVATGADLEIGWLPLVLRESGNPAIQPGQPGYFEATSAVRLLEVPARLDRADGDVHPGGNPHIQLDPRNILAVGEALTARLAQVDPANAAAYKAGFARFAERWKAAMGRWEQAAAPLRGVPVWVQHKGFPYLSAWLGLKELGALEPKPGVEAGSAQLASLLERQKATPAKMILRPAYARPTSSDWMAERAKIPVVVLPYTVGGSSEASDLFGLFDDTLRRLLAGAK